jgi:predicted O-methyltransferase YrrM
MDKEIQTLLETLRIEGRRNDEQEQDRSKKMLNLEYDTARFLSLLLQSSQRQRILEIGTSNGYSTIWLAWAAQAVGGHVISIDRDERKHAQAQENLRKAHLDHTVTLRCGDASTVIADLPGPFDCVFFDADRLSAPTQLHLLLPKLTDHAIVLADNVFSHPDEIAPYLVALDALPQFEAITLPLGKGLSFAYKVR